MYCEILSNTIHCSTHLVSCSYISCKVTVSYIDSMYSLVSHRLMAYCHFFKITMESLWPLSCTTDDKKLNK